MPKQWIHGDLNEQNTLFSHLNETISNDVAGIIDFDDIVHSYRIIDFASCLMHITNIIGLPGMQDRAMEFARNLYQGFTSIVELSSDEMECIFESMLVRYVLSCCISTYQYDYVDPGNEYLLITSKVGWKSMSEWLKLGKEKFMACLVHE